MSIEDEIKERCAIIRSKSYRIEELAKELLNYSKRLKEVSIK